MTFEIDIGMEDEKKLITLRVDPDEKIIESVSGIISYWDIQGEIKLFKEGEELNVNQKWIDSIVDKKDNIVVKSKSDSKRLPKDIWTLRIENEIVSLGNTTVNIINKNNSDSNVEIDLRLYDTPGPIKIGSNIALSFDHHLLLKIPRSYPFSCPTLKWKDDIFHPNIRSSKEGGKVRMKYLENWTFSSDLRTLIQEIKKLLLKPEIDKNWDTRRCNEALECYLNAEFPEVQR